MCAYGGMQCKYFYEKPCGVQHYCRKYFCHVITSQVSHKEQRCSIQCENCDRAATWAFGIPPCPLSPLNLLQTVSADLSL